MVEVDVSSIVRSGEAPVKEAPRSWSPNSPYFDVQAAGAAAGRVDVQQQTSRPPRLARAELEQQRR